jgi:hypothetical protein
MLFAIEWNCPPVFWRGQFENCKLQNIELMKYGYVDALNGSRGGLDCYEGGKSMNLGTGSRVCISAVAQLRASSGFGNPRYSRFGNPRYGSFGNGLVFARFFILVLLTICSYHWAMFNKNI